MDVQSKKLEQKVWVISPKLSDVMKWKAFEQKRRRYKEAVVDQWLVLSDAQREEAIQQWMARKEKGSL